MTEEQQVLEIIRRVRAEQPLREALTINPERVCVEQGLSSSVAEVVMRLVPHLSVTDAPPTHNYWWR